MPDRATKHTIANDEIFEFAGSQLDARAFKCPSGFDARTNRYYGLTGKKGGTTDLILIQKVLIKPEHVGRHFGLFHAWDTKTGNAKLQPNQKNFCDVITAFGGIAGPVRNVQEAEYLLGLWK